MISRLAGFFSIVAGALVAVGAFPAWVTLPSGGGSATFNAFSIVGDNRDAIVSFVVAGALLIAGFVLSARPATVDRVLGVLTGVVAALWAGLLYFSLAPQAHALIAPTGPSASTTIELGLWITAAGGLLGLLAALAAVGARPPVRRPQLSSPPVANDRDTRPAKPAAPPAGTAPPALTGTR